MEIKQLNDQDLAASGRFLLRIQPSLHTVLKKAASRSGVSMNEYCARRLASPAGPPVFPDAGVAVEQALALFGETLIGVAVYGSWARGEETDQSDVDLLLVLESGVRLTRGLYRTWDEHPLVWAGRPVEAQFAHLPESGDPVSGLWGELAVDGIVLFESEFRISRQLVRVRRDIAAGRIVRYLSHGQVYWVENEAA